MRRLMVVLAVLGGVAVPAVPARAGTECTGPRLLGVTGTRVVEGTSRTGYTTMTFTIDSTGCAQKGSIRYQTVGYTARAKVDFLPTDGSISYELGQTGKRTVAVQVVPDAIAEPDKCLSLQIVVAAGSVRADPAEAAGIIIDDDRSGAGGGFRCSE
jgi:hypothetical protein